MRTGPAGHWLPASGELPCISICLSLHQRHSQPALPLSPVGSTCPQRQSVLTSGTCLKEHRSQKQSFPAEHGGLPGIAVPGLLSSTPRERFPGRKSLSFRPGTGQKLEKNIAISTQTMTQRPQEASCHQILIRSLSEREAHTSCLTCASRIHSWNLSIDWKLKPHPPNVSGVCLKELCFLLLGHGYVGVCSVHLEWHTV